jgi:serine/threonine protein kinase
MKQIKKQKIIENKMQEQLLMEIKMQFYLNHPNILKLYGVFSDEAYIYLILEYME